MVRKAVVDVSKSVGPPPYTSDLNRPKPRRHKEYYFEDGNFVIQVYEILYKVWDGMFRRHSQFFESVPSSLPDTEKAKEGSDDEHSLIVMDVQNADFERLLWIIYPPTQSEDIARLDSHIGPLHSVGIHKDIRELAIKELAKFDLDPIEKIELMQTNKIKQQWAYTSFIAVCSRTHALDVIEGRRLGIETTIKIASLRERLEKWGRKRPEEAKKAVCEVFALEPPPTSP